MLSLRKALAEKVGEFKMDTFCFPTECHSPSLKGTIVMSTQLQAPLEPFFPKARLMLWKFMEASRTRVSVYPHYVSSSNYIVGLTALFPV